PCRRAGVAVSAGRSAPWRGARTGALPRARGGDRDRKVRRLAPWADGALVALPAPGTLCAAQPAAGLHRPKAALVPAAPEGGRRRLRLHPYCRTRVRSVSLDALLGTREGSDLFQARGVCAGTHRAGRSRLPQRQTATASAVVGPYDDAPAPRNFRAR